ncbi:extracellular solute-binding protein [Paramicrobacterium chengjingii]|uniref:Extracellular solute-binding protein n=1 Tax=Paramicrobacterium chengjingii TaxID=2769067 RepID=A0ABX6YG91_9MICO|nr:extracellular solute-binding protein [Microbacterium chengjingii]QPZ37808.1 extracellular solute-binding protein [Microbacterium chengjingii]
MQQRSHSHRGRLAIAGIATIATAITLTGCSSGATSADIADEAPTKLEGTVSLWHFFSDREADVIQNVIDDFEEDNPGVTVDVHEGQDDEKVRKVIASGGDIDVALSYSTAVVGNFCSTGAFQDLGPYIDRDKVDMTEFSDTVKSYSEYEGTRCAMPVLADVNALYYNKDILAEAGVTEMPKTLDGLKELALQLTEYNDDGSIKRLGFNPFMGMYENSPAHFGPAVGGQWLTDDGRSAIGSDDGWPVLMTWQKDFVDEIGYDKLQAFTAGLGQEFSAENAFHTGQLAMAVDGEYRTAFIDDQAPDLNYGTAPFPTAKGYEDLYGSGYIVGNIAGIAQGSKHPELAWALLKYLSTDTDALVKMANGLKNVPTTTSALQSPDLEVTEQYQTFIDIALNPKTTTTPPSPVGAGYEQAFGDYWTRYQAGDGGDLTKGLAEVDKQINDSIDLVSGP